jgi:imidazolonepropionase-like amidohydrolase
MTINWKYWAALFSVVAMGYFNLSRANEVEVLSTSVDIPAEAMRYTLFIGPKKVGLEAWWKLKDDTWRLYFVARREQGAEPSLLETVTFNDRFVPIKINSEGKDSDGNPVKDELTMLNGNATWKNSVEEGQKTLNADGYYLTFPVVEQQMSGFPGEIGLLARALLATPTQKLSLIPYGSASISKIQELIVRNGDANQTIVEYEIRGLDFSPVPVWLDQSTQLFAVTGSEWVATIREGWEDSLPAIRKVQRKAANAEAAALTAHLTHHPRGPILFRHVALFDADTAVVQANMAVLVEGDRIRSVRPEILSTVPVNAEVIDARGLTMLPGLWDMHTHLAENDGLLHLSSGVTSVRDLGNTLDMGLTLRRDFEQGTRVGPRVFLAGLIDGRGPFQAPTEVFVDDEQEARAAVEWFSRLGYVHVKIYGQIKPELVSVIARAAHEHGMRVGGHVPANMTAASAVLAGFDEINHTNYLFLNFMPDVTQIQTPLRYLAPAERAGHFDFNSPDVKVFFDLLRERHTVIDPTLNTYETRYTARKGFVDPTLAPVIDEMPFKRRRGAIVGGLPAPPGIDERYRASFQAFLNMIGEIHKAGIATVVGSDGLAGFGYARELELQVRAGVPAADLLRIATIKSAEIMGQDANLGSIVPGKLADLILVEGNPAENISDIRKVRTVMKDGSVFSVRDIRAVLNVGNH